MKIGSLKGYLTKIEGFEIQNAGLTLGKLPERGAITIIWTAYAGAQTGQKSKGTTADD